MTQIKCELVVATLAMTALMSSEALCADAAPETQAWQVAVEAQPLVVLVPPKVGGHFRYPYLLKLPVGNPADAAPALLVETNNTGTLSNDPSLHARAARSAIEQGLGAYVADRLNTPFLMPVFPRTESSPLEYTHALDRDTILTQEESLRRLDRQLVAMIDDAMQRLQAGGYILQEKVLVVGFSASGSFANRFSMLHPDRVAAVAIGGINGIAMLPQESASGIDLPYPIGTADYPTLFGRDFDLPAWRRIPQLLFMGAKDTNDAAQFADAYSDSEKTLVNLVLGARMIPDRWSEVERLYKRAEANARFMTYPDIGHGTNKAINEDVSAFLKQWVDK